MVRRPSRRPRGELKGISEKKKSSEERQIAIKEKSG
jgi:hypothetical protein